MIRFRPLIVLGAVLALLASFAAREARAAAEVHRLNLVLSGIPTSVNGGEYNDFIEAYNTNTLLPQGWEGLPKLGFTWAYDAELRYFVRPNFAVDAGVTQLRVSQKKEFLPAISQGVDVHAEVLSVPVHVGAAYYLQPYNQGDFQARMYFGAGVMSYAYTRATFEQVLSSPDSALTAQFGGSFKQVLRQDSPGYYLEGGAHMFFASHYSVMVGVMWRSGELRNVQLAETTVSGVQQPVPPGVIVDNPKGGPLRIDIGGLGLRMAAAIGF